MSRVQDNVARLVARAAWSGLRPGRHRTNRTARVALEARRAFRSVDTQTQRRLVLGWLQGALEHARRAVPFYADLGRQLPQDFPRSFEEYREWPVLDKATIRLDGERLLSRECDVRKLTRYATGGSTGEPVVIYSSPDDVGWRLSGHLDHEAMIGCPRGRRIGTLYGGELDVRRRPSLRDRLRDWLTNACTNGCFRLDKKYLLTVHNRLESFVPDLLLGYASAVFLLALALEKRSISPSYPRRVVLTAAEKLEPRQREVIERVFRRPVVERYGTREVGLIAYQLPEGDGSLTVDQCFVFVEPDGEPGATGVAPLLVTTLRNRAMPLLRYRIDDLARFDGSWARKQLVSKLLAIEGRTVDMLYLPDGRCLHGLEFPHLFKDFDVNAYQVVQHADGSVVVKIVAGCRHDPAARQRCEKLIHENLPGLAVRFDYVSEIDRPAGTAKLRPVISLHAPTLLT